MAKTYLQLVNEVLKRVREPQVGSVTDSTYSALIGTFVNDAKHVVEDAWQWAALRKQVDFSLSYNNRTYDMGTTGVFVALGTLNERASLMRDPCTYEPLAYDVTSDNQMTLIEITEAEADRQIALEPTPTFYQTPLYFSTTPVSGTIEIKLFERPSAVRSWRMFFQSPQDDMESNTATLLVPYLPVVLLATNYALNEKGEEVGQPGSEADKKYMQALSDAIALDSRYSSDLLVFTP